MTDPDLLSLAVSLVNRAGNEILAIRTRGFAVEHKADRSVVTEADRRAEAIILLGLRQALPDCIVIAEEEAASGVVTAAAGEFWLVDPLDGTKEFTGGGNDFTVNIGLVRRGKPVLGVVGVPASKTVFSGVVGVGAWRQQAGNPAGESAGEPVAIAARLPPFAGLTVVCSRHHGDQARLDAYLAGRRVANVVNFGSSLKFCRLAEGQADLYPRFGRTMEWDTCAAHAVLEAAGGHVETLDGAPLTYGKPGWENPHFVCWGRRPD